MTKKICKLLREYNPVDDCPLCAAKQRVLAKVFVPVYDEETQEIKIWDRGKTFFSKISSLCARYNPLVSTPFEIERNGKKGDTSTTYETYALETDDLTLEDFPEVPELLGTLILDKTYEELEFYLDNGYFEEDVEMLWLQRNRSEIEDQQLRERNQRQDAEPRQIPPQKKQLPHAPQVDAEHLEPLRTSFNK